MEAQEVATYRRRDAILATVSLWMDVIDAYLLGMERSSYHIQSFNCSPLTVTQVVLNDPALWTNVECLAIHPLAIHSVLFRSRNLPLRLSFESLPFLDEGSFHSLNSWLSSPVRPRVQALAFASKGIELMGYLPANMPNLQELEIFDLAIVEDPPVLYHFKHDCNFPQLTCLKLVGFLTTWMAPIFTPTLTHLHWELHHDDDPLEFLEASKLIPFLARMPKLRHLTLVNALNMSSTQNVQKTMLPLSLDFIELYFLEESRMANLLGFIQIPATTSVVMKFGYIWSSEDICQAALDLFQGAFAEKSEPRELFINNLGFYMRPSKPESSALSPPEDTLHEGYPRFEEPRSRCMLYKDFKRSAHEHRHEDGPLFDGDNRRLLQYLPFASITVITFVEAMRYFLKNAASWITHFTRAKSVRHLYLPFSEQVTSLCAALEETTDESKSTFTLFPLLETVTFGRSAHDTDIDQDGRTLLSLTLMSALDKRREGGAPIREVRVAREAELWEGDPWIGVRELVQLTFVKC